VLYCQLRHTGPQNTAAETLLFNSLQFILTVGFAWFSTKAVSRIEFEQSLKKFAISAYRRVADIERMVDRLHTEVLDMISETTKSEVTNLRIVDAIVSDTSQLVRSSISDWGDVIGEELLAIERIKRLEHERARLDRDDLSAKRPFDADQIRKEKALNQAIASILETLPAKLQLDTESESPATQVVRRTARSIARRHRAQKGLRLTVFTGGLYLSERDYKTLTPGEILSTEKDKEGGIDVRDGAGLGVGRLLNFTQVDYDSMVSALELCYGSARISLEFMEEGNRYIEGNEETVCLEMRIVTEPVL